MSRNEIRRHIAMTRFGLGASQRDLEALGRDPRGWVRGQIGSSPIPTTLSALPGSAAGLRSAYADRNLDPGMARKTARRETRRALHEVHATHLVHQLGTATPLTERLVRFWANHFTVSRTRGVLSQAIPGFVTEAIRPHVYGRFEDMLQAVIAHPVMLIYLDNVSSIGPNSKQGKRRGKDLNENLAREILELHTLGARGGYDQADVTHFAKALTGWHVETRGRKMLGRAVSDTGASDAIGTFRFQPNRHEPGPQTILGRAYRQSGAAQARAVLSDLASHPSTARHIAVKLAAHFISDTPPPDVVGAMEKAFRRHDGNLSAVMHALLEQDAAWEGPGQKVKPPYDFMVSALRLMAPDISVGDIPTRLFEQSLKSMGQDLQRAPSPAGWPDDAAHWVAPSTLMRRLEWAQDVARRLPAGASPDAYYDLSAGPLAQPASRRLIAGAPSREQGLALVLSAPAFQRR